MSILRFLFQTVCAFLKDRKDIEQNYQSVLLWDLGVLGGSKTYALGFGMAPHRLCILVCLCLFIFSFFFFLATFSFIFSRDVPF